MIGVDVVSVPRFRRTIEQQSALAARLFTTEEREYCSARGDPVRHLAGTLAGKEAVIKCLQLGPLVAWARRIEIDRAPSGAPRARVRGHPPVAISITHDGDLAIAVALLSGVREEEAT